MKIGPPLERALPTMISNRDPLARASDYAERAFILRDGVEDLSPDASLPEQVGFRYGQLIVVAAVMAGRSRAIELRGFDQEWLQPKTYYDRLIEFIARKQRLLSNPEGRWDDLFATAYKYIAYLEENKEIALDYNRIYIARFKGGSFEAQRLIHEGYEINREIRLPFPL